jgi:O-antigen/teichoic acid export membrane protein
VGGRAASDALQLLLYVAIVRRFTEQTIGDYSFAFALAMVLGMIVGLGVRSLVTREVSNDPSLGAAYPLNLLVLHGALSLFVIAGLVAWATIAAVPVELLILCLLAFGAIGLTTVGYGAVAVVDASGRVHRGAQAEVTGKVCTVILGFMALLAGLDIVFIMAAQMAGAAVYLGLALRWASQAYGPLAWRIDVPLILRTARSSLPFALAAILYALYARVDIIMLHRLAGAAETAYYAVAYRIVETSLVVATMSGIAMFPELAAGGATGTAMRREIFGQAVRWLAVLGAFVAVPLLVGGDQLAVLVFGDDFETGGDLLRAMAMLVVLGYVKVPFWRLLIAQRREMLQLYIQAPAVALNILLNLLLIPRYGGFGAVAASLVSESLMLLGFSVAVFRHGWLSLPKIAGWSGAVSLACMVGLGLRLVTQPLAAAIVAAIILALALRAFRVITLEEIPLKRRLGRSSRGSREAERGPGDGAGP